MLVYYTKNDCELGRYSEIIVTLTITLW